MGDCVAYNTFNAIQYSWMDFMIRPTQSRHPICGIKQENATLAVFLGLLKLFVLKPSKYEAKEVLQIEEK
jgi:hypothetical protein